MSIYERRPGPDDPFVLNEAGAQLDDPGVRRRFVAQSLGLAALQLVFAGAFIASCFVVEDLRQFLEKYYWLSLVALSFGCFILAMMTVIPSRRARLGSLGLVCLVVVMASLAYAMAVFSLVYSGRDALLAASAAALITLTICLAATCTCLDVTKYRVNLKYLIWAILCCIVILFGLGCVWPESRVIEMLLGISIAVLANTMLLFDMQMILGGCELVLRTDEVIYAATELYTDIMFSYDSLLKCSS